MEPLFELHITTAPPGSREVASHLFRQLKDAILAHRLPHGARLPSTRAAVRLFSVSRNTAQDVYDRLAVEGLVYSRPGAGTFVNLRPQEQTRPQISMSPIKPRVGNDVWGRSEIQASIGFWRERTNEVAAFPIVADLRPALIDQGIFPHAAFRQIMARQLRRLETAPPPSRSPQGNQGNYRLREAIAEHVGLTRAVPCEAGEVLVTAGAQQAFDLLARTLVTSGETVVAIEDPGYPPLRAPFAAAGARIVPVRVDAEGIVVDEIPPDAAIICVCPSHQFPLGMPLSLRRRDALIEFARRTGAAIIEDDYDGEFRYEDRPINALRGEGSEDHVFYVGSFSKCMLPSLRLGFVIAPAWAMPALVMAKNASDWHCASPIQMAVAEFVRGGHLSRHIRRARRIYLERRNHLVGLLRRELTDAVTIIPSLYGMHMSVISNVDVDCEAVSEALEKRGVQIHSLQRYYMGVAERSGFVIGFAAVERNSLEVAITALGKAFRQSGA